MVVFVQFLGLHRRLVQASQIKISLPEDACVRDVVSVVKDKYPQLELANKDLMITVNDRVSGLNQELSPEDNITFVPHIGGG